MRGEQRGDTGSSQLPSFLGGTKGQCAWRFPSTKQLQGGSSWKGLQFSGHVQQSLWPLEHCGLASLPFSGDPSSEGSYSNPHPRQGGDTDVVPSEKVDSHRV